MKNKKIISILLACIIIAGSSISALGAETYSQSLKTAIQEAKNIINVPNDYTEFSYLYKEDMYENMDDKDVEGYRLSWKDKDSEKGYIDVVIDKYGNIINYNNYDYKNYNTNLAKISRDDARKTANNFIDKVLKLSQGEIKEDYSSMSANKYEFEFKQYINNVPIETRNISVSVNKFTGEVSYYSLRDDINIKKVSFENLEGVKSLDLVKDAYIEKIGLKMKYYSVYDDLNNRFNLFPAYVIENNDSVGIDAKSLEVVDIKNNYFGYGMYDNVQKESISEAAYLKDESIFTEEEISEISKIDKLINAKEAEKIIRNNFDNITSSNKVDRCNLYKLSKREGEGYMWQIYFENGSAQVDAESGEVNSFYYYNDKNEYDNIISEEKAEANAKAILKKLNKEKFKLTKEIDNIQNDENDEYNFEFVRIINGIEYSANKLSVSIDKQSGKVNRFYTNWYENIYAPSIQAAMGEKEILDKVIEDKNLGLKYVQDANKGIRLVYNFDKMDTKYLINPFTGQRIGYDGKPYNEVTEHSYDDISGNKYESAINILLDNGYYLDGDKFNPDTGITQEEFLNYISSKDRNYLSDGKMYDEYMNSGVIEENEKDPNKILTNKDISKYVVRIFKYEDLAKKYELFNNVYSDNVSDEYKGYAAICYGLNIMPYDGGSAFDEDGEVTRGQAAQIIYNMLKNENLY